ncbi:MAG: SRPBCC family protein [Acidobacteriota bacterium]
MQRAAQASAHLDASREVVYDIVSDYERYRAWIPNLAESQLLTQEGDISIAEFRAPLWSERSVTLELVHTPPSTISFQQIDSIGRPSVSGYWRLEEADSGVIVQARLRVATPFFQFGSRRRLHTELQLTLDALGARQRELSTGRGSGGSARRKVLEIIRQADGLKLWYLGETYLVPKVREPGAR